MPITEPKIDKTGRIVFSPDDFEYLDKALDVVPELRICALVLKRAREIKIDYPIKSLKHLMKLMPEKELRLQGHQIQAVHIDRYMTDELFPIADAADLASRIHVALTKCREDIMWASRAPKYAPELLKELIEATTASGPIT